MELPLAPGEFSTNNPASSSARIDFDDGLLLRATTTVRAGAGECVPHEAAHVFKWARWMGLGSANRYHRLTFQGILACMIVVQPQCAVTSSHSWLYAEQDTNFGRMWMALSVAVGAGLLACHWFLVRVMDDRIIERARNPDDLAVNGQGQALCLVRSGHLCVLLADVRRFSSIW